MRTQKAGSILINLENFKIGLIYRKSLNDYSFPKGHLEKGESLAECAVRETIEETGRMCEILQELEVLEYTTSKGEEVSNSMFLTLDLGEYEEEIPEDLKEALVWVSYRDVEDKLSYNDLKEFWNRNKSVAYQYLRKGLLQAE